MCVWAPQYLAQEIIHNHAKTKDYWEENTMASFLDHVRNLMLPSAPYDDDDYDDEYLEEDYYDEPEPQPRNIAPVRSRRSANHDKVVSINTNVSMQVVVSSTVSIEEAAEVCKHLKERKTIVINLEKTEAEIAQRISDFLCGAGYALDCSIQSISDEIFIICPANVKITGEFKQELAANGIKIPTAAIWRN